MLTTSEKATILKTVNIFSGTPDEILSEVAVLLKEVRVKGGETVFDKGAMGASMYVIATGRVRVHDGERTLNHLGERDVFGEMALVDSQPRLASVSAVENTCLLRLDHEPFFKLMDERSEVARGIIHILSRYLRARVQDLADLRTHLENVILPLGIALSSEDNLDRLLERILLEAKSFCNADAGTLYLLTEDDRLRFAIMRSDALNMAVGGTTGREAPSQRYRVLHGRIDRCSSIGSPSRASFERFILRDSDSVCQFPHQRPYAYEIRSNDGFRHLSVGSCHYPLEIRY